MTNELRALLLMACGQPSKRSTRLDPQNRIRKVLMLIAAFVAETSCWNLIALVRLT